MKKWPEQDRWQQLCQSAGATGGAGTWYTKLTAAYAESRRHYHNQQHIAECLAEFDGARYLAQNPATVEFALWFHDVVYDPKAADNEELSALMSKSCLVEVGLPELATKVGELVMATKSHSTEAGPDAGLMVDVDLSILGQSEERFAEYEAQIRDEYRWVPGLVFKPKRAEILQRFLDRPRIYTTELFASRYEQTARHNLKNSIQKLNRLFS